MARPAPSTCLTGLARGRYFVAFLTLSVHLAVPLAEVLPLLTVEKLVLALGDLWSATGRPLMVSLLSGRDSFSVNVPLVPLFTLVSLALMVALFLASETRAMSVLEGPTEPVT